MKKKNEKSIEILTNLGLTQEQALVYQTLLEHGFMKAGSIPAHVSMKRGLVYKVLNQLIELGLVEKHGKDAIARYAPLSPEKLNAFLEKKKQELAQQEEAFTTIYGNLKSQFNLLSGKPSVQYFEGERGIQKVVEDSLFAETEVLQYIDSEALLKEIPDINLSHAQARREAGIHKKMLVPDTPFMRKRKKHLSDELTDVRIIPQLKSFPNIMQIYDNKVTYISFRENKKIGIILEDRDIAEMHRELFMIHWKTAREEYNTQELHRLHFLPPP